jgi:hypothetical protein
MQPSIFSLTWITEIFDSPIAIDTTTIAGMTLWSLALYLAFASLGDWVAIQLNRWFNYAERSLYTDVQEFEKTREVRESVNALYASVLSIVPFLVLGVACELGMEWGLGRDWSVSAGLFGCFGCGVYELGRRDSRTS